MKFQTLNRLNPNEFMQQNFTATAHKEMRDKYFPFQYEDGPMAVMGVK